MMAVGNRFVLVVGGKLLRVFTFIFNLILVDELNLEKPPG